MLWLFSLLFVSFSVLSWVFIQSIKREKEKYLLSITNDVEKIQSSQNQDLDTSIATANSIFFASWYKHYCANSSIYLHEFNGAKMQEIVGNLGTTAKSLPFVYNISMITPSPQNTIINKDGWFSFEKYKQIFGDLEITPPMVPEKPLGLVMKHPDFAILTINDPTRISFKRAIVLHVKKSEFSHHFLRKLPEEVVYAQVILDNQLLFQSGERTDNLIVKEVPLHFRNSTLTIGYHSFEETLLPQRQFTFLLQGIILVLSSILLSLGLTNITLRPVHSLLRKVGESGIVIADRQNDPYRSLSNSLVRTSQENHRLRLREEEIQSTVTDFLFELRNEIVLGMLTNPSFCIESEYLEVALPWIRDSLPYYLVYLAPTQKRTAIFWDADVEMLTSGSSFSSHATFLYHDFCLLLWFENENQAKTHRSSIQNLLQQAKDSTFLYSISDIQYELETMNFLFVELKRNLSQKDSLLTPIPVSLQIGLINAILQNKLSEALLLLQEFHGKVEAVALFELLMDFGEERGIATSKLFEEYKKNQDTEQQWRSLYQMVPYFVEEAQVQFSDSTQGKIRKIQEYIHQNYTDSNLSMKQLETIFGLHRTMISKYLKELTSVTFSEYLQKRRINKAKLLITQTDETITDISTQVGYQNYNTFRRAFIRQQGCSPTEYRDIVKNKDDSQ